MPKYSDLRIDSMISPRAQRAHRFANTMLGAILGDFIPRDREIHRRISDYLTELAYEHNLEIINVPPECDELDKVMLERRMLEVKLDAMNFGLWQPIVLAPNDQRSILAVNENSDIQKVSWRTEVGGAEYTAGCGTTWAPTHFMPLRPPPPKPEKKDAV